MNNDQNMDALESLIDKLPDIYFDWYARFLPGGAAVLLLLLLTTRSERDFALEHPLLLVAASYLLGHFIQPASAFFVNSMERDMKRESEYAKYKRKEEKDKNTGLLRKVSKAHAEAVSMMSAALLVLSILLYLKFSEGAWSWLLAVTVGALVLFSWERVRARYRKIDDLG